MTGEGHCGGIMDKKRQPMTNGVGLSRGGLAPEVPLFPSMCVCVCCMCVYMEVAGPLIRAG